MSYRELPPPPGLAPLLRCLWVRRPAADGVVAVLPDGCVDLVVRDGHASVAGADTRAVASPVRAGETIVGARIAPGSVAALLGVPASELRDARVPLDAVWGAFAAELGERSASGGPRALAATLAERAAPRAGRPDAIVGAAAAALAGRPGRRIEELAAALGIGERQLRRRFHASVGYGPKTYARVMRLRRLLELLRRDEPLAGAAAAAGYSDQPHMTRETRALTGRSPGALL